MKGLEKCVPLNALPIQLPISHQLVRRQMAKI